MKSFYYIGVESVADKKYVNLLHEILYFSLCHIAAPTGPPPPPRPPPPIPTRHRSGETGQAAGGAASGVDMFRVPVTPSAQQMITTGDPEEGELPWSCSACTFSNHPALRKCEMCEMPRVMAPHPTIPLGPPPLNPHQAFSSLAPRLAPGSSVLTNMHPRTGSPQSFLGHHYHRAGKFSSLLQKL